MIQQAVIQVRQLPVSDENRCGMRSGMSISPPTLLILSFPTYFRRSHFHCPTFFAQTFIDDIHHRTHRQRTQNYIKTLESEVLRLRSSEGDLTQVNKRLQNQVDLLHTTLLSANVQLPAGFEGSPQSAQASFSSSDMPATIAYRADNANHERLHVTWPEPPPPPPARKPLPQSAQCSQQPPDLSFEVNFDSAVDHSNQDWYGTGSKPLPHLPRGTLPPFSADVSNTR